MKAKMTKSGRWQCRYVDHYETINGKRKVVLGTVTMDTERDAIKEALARENKNERSKELTFEKALAKYIDLKRNVLSPTTLRSYTALQNNAFEILNPLPLSKISSAQLQSWINYYSGCHSPKSVFNAHGLVMAVMGMFRPEAKFCVTLPQKRPARLYTPSDEDITALLAHISGTALERAVLLAAFGTLRRGEACALTMDDIDGCSVTVSGSMVRASSGWLVKAPKTPQSVRTVKLPTAVVKRLTADRRTGESIVGLNPEQVRKAFKKALRDCGLPDFRFHDLRAYAVSIRHALGIPDVYIMQDGGYKTDAVMKQVYRRSMDDKRSEFSKIANEHFSDMLQKL